MNLKVKLIFGVIGILFLTNNLCASNHSISKFPLRPIDSLEVLISCLEKDDAKLTQIKLAFKSEISWNYLGFCNQHSLLIIRTGKTQTEINELLEAISKRVGTSQVAIKQIGFGDILNFCEFDSKERERVIKKGK